ncbi:SDR family oxidoreductase [Methylobacterium trifolii]|uniref:General stress protein 39 n=1 Tax=Methylobacterium trifolii TaxID=1003092 RepID=A0ABQ4U1X2_9HYPH|nr:SDR family oxidoreductase [Methylobacterium trifolii]GJE61465.1 General stress protein 39 [Methylobacterium trifolii]
MSDSTASNGPSPRPAPPFPGRPIPYPGRSDEMQPRPDHGEASYTGSGKLSGKVALITGGDSGIGRAVAIAYAREGADVALSYLDEHDDAQDTAAWVEKAGRRALLLPGDVADAGHCAALVEKTVAEFGRLDVVVNNAAVQVLADDLEGIAIADWDRQYAVNVHAMFYILKAASPHLKPGASIIATSSVNAKVPVAQQLAYSSTKAALCNMVANLAQILGKRGIRANAVLPGPIWTPLIPATMYTEQVEGFGSKTPAGRPGQPAELAPAYVMLASDEASYVNGAMVAVTGGMVTI